MLKKLSRTDWIDAGLRALGRDGFTALKADLIARKLAVSRGSFYWHFADVAAFETAVMRRWRDVMAEAIIRDLERVGPKERLRRLLRLALDADPRLEIAMRAWASSDARAHALIRSVDRRRLAYLERMLADGGVAAGDVRPRAQILYWTYLGFVLSAKPISRTARERLINELAALGRGEARPAGDARRVG